LASTPFVIVVVWSAVGDTVVVVVVESGTPTAGRVLGGGEAGM
jgi:exo-beta-1,3-glucanase (GH17 family)